MTSDIGKIEAPMHPAPQSEGRLDTLDVFRGFIMVLMAIDHASYFVAKVHHGEFWGSTLPQHSDLISFLTRWLTHLCAPGFFFLMGTGMALFAQSRITAGWHQDKITRYFLFRGMLLIVLQLLVENLAWLLGAMGKEPNRAVLPGGGGEVWLYFGVLFGLGANMILFALLRQANTFFLGLISLGAFFIAQWAIPGPSETAVLHSPIQRLFLIPGHTGLWLSYYPVIPWAGITGAGIIFGRMLVKDRTKLFQYCAATGAALLLCFVLVRWANGFGNFHKWNSGVVSFLNVTKYPPSLSFVLLTVGINLLLLFFFSRPGQRSNLIWQPLLIFGRSALFFYVVHLYFFALIGFAMPDGTSHPWMYLWWCIGLVILFPLCLWYGTVKHGKSMESLWRLF